MKCTMIHDLSAAVAPDPCGCGSDGQHTAVIAAKFIQVTDGAVWPDANRDLISSPTTGQDQETLAEVFDFK